MSTRFRLENNAACGDPECCGSYEEYVADGDAAWMQYADLVVFLNKQDDELTKLQTENAKLRAKIDRVKELDGREIMDNLYFDWNAVFNALSDEPEQGATDEH